MSFKKNGTDPGFDMPAPILPGLPGGSSWLGRAAQAVQDFVAAAVEPPSGLTPWSEHDRVRRSRRPQQKPKRRRNMLHVSKRVRRKHRRASK